MLPIYPSMLPFPCSTLASQWSDLDWERFCFRSPHIGYLDNVILCDFKSMERPKEQKSLYQQVRIVTTELCGRLLYTRLQNT